MIGGYYMSFAKLFNTIRSTALPSDIENVSIKRLIPKINEWNIDTIKINTSKNCDYCKKYNGKIFSLYGKDKKYPKMPDVLFKRSCPVCGKVIGATMANL